MDMTLPRGFDRGFAAPAAPRVALLGAREPLAPLIAGSGWRIEPCALDGAETLRSADLLLLATAGPDDGDPLDLLRRLRDGSDCPLAVVGPALSEVDQIVLLELGADDVLALPMAPRLLVARLRALLRRGRSDEALRRARRAGAGALLVDVLTRRAWHDGRPVELTPTEVELLHALASQAGRPVERDRLQACLRASAGTQHARSLDVMVSRLRRHLRAQAVGDVEIRAVPGYGYCLRSVLPAVNA